MVYGVYARSAMVHWSPAKIFGDEIRVRAYPLLSSASPDDRGFLLIRSLVL